MMNVLALCLVLTTLVTAGVWSPSPSQQKTKILKNDQEKEDVIVKEGHRVVVVEFDEKDDGHVNTKVKISPHDVSDKGYVSNAKEKLSGVVEDAKEKLSSSGFDEGGEDENGGYGHRPSARELVCDAFGKCKHRIASALGKSNDVVSEKAEEVADKGREIEEEAEESVGEATGKVKDMVNGVKGKVKDGAIGAKESVEEGVKEAAKKAKWGVGKAKEAVEEGVSEVAEQAKHGAGKAKEGVSEATEKAKWGAGKAKEGATEAAEKARHRAGELKEGVTEAAEKAKWGAGKAKEGVTQAAEKARQGAGKVKEGVTEVADKARHGAEDASEKMKHGAHKIKEGGKDLKDILQRGLQVLYDVFAYVFSPDSLGSFMGILHLLGFATAYGMSVWVTFLSSYVLAGALPRQQFAMVQSKLYPVYFKAMAYSVGMALLGHLLSQRKKLSLGSAEMFQGFNLLSSLLMVLGNLIYLEPRASKVMFERLKWEKEEGRGRDVPPTEPSTRATSTPVTSVTSPAMSHSPITTPAAVATTDDRPLRTIKLSETLKKLNSYSSLLNILTLMGLTWHLVHAGHRLHAAAC